VEAFNSLDWAKIGTANIDDFRRLLRDNGFYTSNEELFKVMERFDKNKDGRIS
jgi:Ca2+-binding EF-hand superfamily protein